MKWSEVHLLPNSENPIEIRNWRLRQAIVSCSSWAIIMFFVLPALVGKPFVIPMVGMVAWANDVDEKIAPLNDSVTDIKEMMLENSILVAQKNWCDSNAKGEHATAWAARVRDLSKEYYKQVGRAFELPACNAL